MGLHTLLLLGKGFNKRPETVITGYTMVCFLTCGSQNHHELPWFALCLCYDTCISHFKHVASGNLKFCFSMQTYFCWHYFSEMETYAAIKTFFSQCNKNCHLKIGQDITD